MATSVQQPHVRINETTHRTLQALSRKSGETMTTLVDRAVESYRREQLFAEAAVAWEAILNDPEALAELEREYAIWETTVGDGLVREEW